MQAPVPDTPAPKPRPSAAQQFARFLIVGPIGLTLGALQYELLYRLNPFVEFQGSSTWLLSSAIGILWVHALHCHFTFAHTGRGRWRATIGRAYVLYATSIALGTLLMWLLHDEFGVQRTTAWLITSALTSVFNFVFLRRLLGGRGGDGDGFLTLDDVTIIVPTKDERDNVDAFVASLPPEVHLLVVDAGDDGTRERILELRPERTRVLPLKSNIPIARQRGAELATTPWLLFTDIDVSFAPDYFAHLRDVSVTPRLGGIVGAKGSLDRYRGYYSFFVLGQRLLAAVGIPGATGSNMLMRRAALLECGGFDPALSVNEDTEVMWRCQRSGWGVRYEEDLMVHERDHRRLDRGVGRKLGHSILRCVLLYLGILPQRWRVYDWGYWKPTPIAEERPARS